MIGMDANTGKLIGGRAHLAQSLTILFTTPIGSRVMRRRVGALLFDLVDAPANLALKAKLFGTIALAVMRWEPRVQLTRIGLSPGETRGAFVVDLEGNDLEAPPASRAFRESILLTAPSAGGVSPSQA